MNTETSEVEISKPETADSAAKRRNDAARVLIRYLNYVAMFRSDKQFGASATNDDPAQIQELTRKCRAAAFKMGLIGFVRDQIVLTAKGKRFVPTLPSADEKRPAEQGATPSAQPLTQQ